MKNIYISIVLASLIANTASLGTNLNDIISPNLIPSNLLNIVNGGNPSVHKSSYGSKSYQPEYPDKKPEVIKPIDDKPQTNQPQSTQPQ
ncbi:hypothetical protein K502DRAFT_346891, partial [Neoconidiobolus thromboides FSU 785]